MSDTNEPGYAVTEILTRDAETYQRKAADYAPEQDRPFENFEFAATFAARLCRGLPEDDKRRATAVLVGTKISRLMTVGLSKNASNETILDTHRDLRVYLAILERQQTEATEDGISWKFTTYQPCAVHTYAETPSSDCLECVIGERSAEYLRKAWKNLNAIPPGYFDAGTGKLGTAAEAAKKKKRGRK